MSINKVGLAKMISEKTGITKKKSMQFMDELLETVKQELAEGKKVQLVGFGTFMARKREKRPGRSPVTGEVITIPEARVPVFRVGKRSEPYD